MPPKPKTPIPSLVENALFAPRVIGSPSSMSTFKEPSWANTITSKPKMKISPRFCAMDNDITFKSSDDVHFMIHDANIQAHIGGFAVPEFQTQDDSEPVSLPEDSTILELLFQFIYPDRHPDLESTTFDVLKKLAEAAEKYKVFSAMNVCKIRMKNFISEHPGDLLAYGAEHDYPDIVNAAAPLMLHRPLGDVFRELPVKVAINWVMYYDKWSQVLRAAFNYLPNLQMQTHNEIPVHSPASSIPKPTRPCSGCSSAANTNSCLAQILVRLGQGVGSLTTLDSTFATQCDSAKSQAETWRLSVEEDIKEIPTLAVFCKSS